MLYRATLADIDVMAAIHAAAFPPKETWGRDVFSLQLDLPGVFGLLHPAGGMILARVAADEAEILTIAVTPEARRGGIGASLLSAAMSRAATMGAITVFLEVSVVNTAAFALYAKAGFTMVGKRRHYYADNTDALVMRCDVSPGC
jgi:ribosomal-protein-alanine N-acetyltransferase